MKRNCPYSADLPDHHYWSKSVAAVAPDVDPVVRAPFGVSTTDKVVTAGSCFAQHIARALQANGFNYHVGEDIADMVPRDIADAHGYGLFSARYGNVYTTRQLVQLFDRAHGLFVPEEPNWHDGQYWQDPFRPRIQPRGFVSEAELLADRESHFRAVREIFREADVFIFTLGLTECWVSKIDGAVFPVCPGCGAGSFDASRYEFRNFPVAEVTADLQAFIDRLRGINPDVRIILTVSPVPLVATMEDRSVLVSTVYSKSVLRVAAEEIVNANEAIAYFPSYEIVTSNYSAGAFFGPDWREVRPEGVAQVMRLFLRHYCGVEAGGKPGGRRPAAPRRSDSERIAELMCEEEMLDPFG